MKATALILNLLHFMIAATLVTGYCQDTETDIDCSNGNALSRYKQEIIKYTSSFLSFLQQTYPDSPAVGSPVGSLYLLSILGLYSCGATNRALLRVLKLSNNNQIRCAIEQLNTVIPERQGNLLFTINGTNIFGNIQYPFTDAFKKDTENLIVGKALNTDFKNKTDTANYINEVVKNETRNFITSIVSPDDGYITSDTKLFTVTALYFSPASKYRFDPNKIITQKFYISPEKSVDVPFVYQKALYNYTNSRALGATVVELLLQGPYANILILPNEDTSIDIVIKRLGNPVLYNIVLNSFKPAVVELTFPAFDDVTSTFNVSQFAQQNLGSANIIFDERAEFCGMIKNDIPVFLSKGIQKFIFKGSFNGGQEPVIPKGVINVKVNANRPYIYLVTAARTPIIAGTRPVP